jgi:hypothetical protein
MAQAPFTLILLNLTLSFLYRFRYIAVTNLAVANLAVAIAKCDVEIASARVILLGLACGLSYRYQCSYAGACLAHVPPLLGDFLGGFLPALPLSGTLFVAVVVLLRLTVDVRNCE